MTPAPRPTPTDRQRRFAAWCHRRSLTPEQGRALLVGLAAAGFYLWLPDETTAAIRVKGGPAIEAVVGRWVLQGLGAAEGER